MFTGIVEAVGHIAAIEARGGDVQLRIHCPQLGLADVKLGDSIAVSGVCLTVTALSRDGFAADVSNESLRSTRFADLQVGHEVNLEKALLASARLGGHMVSGHVDGVAEVVSRCSEGRSERFTLRAPQELARYIAAKGSVCIDGVSLTVNQVEGGEFVLNIIPLTLQETTLHHLQAGEWVNLEVDLVARYLERLLTADQGGETKKPISKSFLAEHGFLK